ncbi:trichome birefringence-like protein 19 [Tanacetum coccineum]
MKFLAVNESETIFLTRRRKTSSKFILVKPTNPLPSSSNDPLHVHTNTTLPNLQPPSRKEEHEWVNGYVLKRKGSGGTCDLFSGEWVENPEGPYYTNETCRAIQEHQNCMKFGRTDRDFLKWRWKPYKCELPIFDPMLFLEMMAGKSLAFVGDSVARNHMQSLLCLLSRVAYPNDVTNSSDQNFKRYEFPEYSFNISIFWSPYLVNTERTDQQDVTQPFRLYLDVFDES